MDCERGQQRTALKEERRLEAVTDHIHSLSLSRGSRVSFASSDPTIESGPLDLCLSVSACFTFLYFPL